MEFTWPMHLADASTEKINTISKLQTLSPNTDVLGWKIFKTSLKGLFICESLR